ncbi:MAG: carboxypeptidase regulatory-like domain-containing protein [Gemmatirosa sp.]|nr:carboxypeptidase regulatory-like domain-containing protein [Gemmatirosa sp.]
MPVLRPLLRATAPWLAAAACAARLHGQPGPLRPALGTVRDSASRRPLPGAVVLLLDSLGRTVSRATTDEAGRYRVPVSADARRMRVLRLGFRPQERPLAVEAPGEFALVPIPMLLTSVRVAAAASCPARADRGAAFALLEQVRAGLLATVVARAQRPARMTRLLYERRFDGGGDRIAHQSVSLSFANAADRSFGAARSGAAFVAQGFLDQATNTYFGPDPETLIDEGFAAGYCFQLATPDRGRPGQVGLEFAAARPRDGRIDIAGALWVDTVARSLGDLEFRYVGLDRRVAALSPGGRLSFRDLANGITVIDRWSMRLVSGELAAGADGPFSRSTSRLHVTEVGGELATAAWPNGYAWSAPLGTLRLHTVTHDGRSAAGTVVRLDDTDYEATADSAGVAEIPHLLPGPYAVSIADPRLAALGVPLATPLRFVAERDSVATRRLEVATAEDFTAARCLSDRSRTKTADTSGTGWLLGRVSTPDGRAADGARWTIRDREGSLLVEGGRVGGDGLFHWCRLARGTPIVVEASQGGRRATARAYLEERLTIVPLVLRDP